MNLKEKAVHWFTGGNKELEINLREKTGVTEEYMLRQYLTRFPWEKEDDS